MLLALEFIFMVAFLVGLFARNPVLIICGAGGALASPFVLDAAGLV